MAKMCFMIMPYGRKPTQAEAGHGPAEIDYNALWDRGYVPVIRELGYEPVRADQDTGALIITQMLERLYFADLVLADMTTPNGNVYYEVGIRHAAQKTGCVMLAADWSRQLFDVVQMRTIRYPLPEGDITEQTAAAFQSAIKDKIEGLADGVSPMHLSIRGYPSEVDERDASTMKERMEELAAFQAKVREVRVAPQIERIQLAQRLIATDGTPPATYPVALALMSLLRDSADDGADWNVVLDFVRGLSPKFAQQPETIELLNFAIGQTGDNVKAIAGLQTLIATVGPTPERLGLLGGRYKRLWISAKSDADRRKNLSESIEAYQRGMDLDLNAYYCSCNLPRLYRERDRQGDEEKAQMAAQVSLAACERARKRAVQDEWLRPTLLGAAFDAGDVRKAESLADELISDGTAQWKFKSMLYDIEVSIKHVEDPARRDRLTAVIDRLKNL